MTKVAVVQAGTVPFDTPATVRKAGALVAEAAEAGAKLALFPEAFIGGYPKGADFSAVVGYRYPAGRELYGRYTHRAITLDGPEVAQLSGYAARHDVFIVCGIIERLGGTLYCTAVMIDPAYGLVGKHRKLMPTGMERLVWGFGDGSTLDVVDSPAGVLGAVICWENYMPLLRQAMYAQGVQVYCAPTADDRPTWQSSMVHIAMEGRTYVLSACQVLAAEDVSEHYKNGAPVDDDGLIMRGGSLIVDPRGTVLAGPAWGEETILYAEVDPSETEAGHFDFDAVGHYARPDVFELIVRTEPQGSVRFTG